MAVSPFTLPENLSPTAAAAIAALEKQFTFEKRGSAGSKDAQAFLGCSDSQLARKTRDNAIPSFLNGVRRMYPMLGLYQHLVDMIVASNPAGEAPRKARQPKTMFRSGENSRTIREHLDASSRRRKRTARQLDALRRGNEVRLERARIRREQEPAL